MMSRALLIAGPVAFLAVTPVTAADVLLPPPVASEAIIVAPASYAVPAVVPLKPPRRYLTTYMARYPFGVLREDYTPLGAPGVSKADYFGRPMRTATLHVSPRRAWRYDRVVLRTRY